MRRPSLESNAPWKLVFQNEFPSHHEYDSHQHRAMLAGNDMPIFYTEGRLLPRKLLLENEFPRRIALC